MRRRSPQIGVPIRLTYMASRWLFCLLFATLVIALGAEPSNVTIAKRLAERARLEREHGDVVRAYLLYNEAAKRDPATAAYAASRDGLAPSANLLMRTQLEAPVVAADIARIEKEEADAEAAQANPLPPGAAELHQSLASFPHVEAKDTRQDFDLRGDEISLIQKVAAAYGVRASWDPQLDVKKNLQLQLTQADFRTAMEALTAVTDTFVFPISNNTLYFARDTETKRNELEPMILLTVPLPDAVNEKDLVDVANAVRGLLNLRTFGWDSFARTVFIRDRVSRALAARSLLEALLLPKAQVELEVQVLTFDKDVNYHWGVSPPTSASFYSLTPININSVLAAASTIKNLIGIGGGASLFGVSVGQASLFGNYSKSEAKTSFDAVLVTTDGQAATAHYGEKYPIPQTLYTGYSQSSPSIYNPVPQFQQEDLGLSLKLTPHVNGEGTVALDVDAEYKALGTIVLNSVPSVAQRKFTGNVTLREGEWAILAGLDQDSVNRSRDGLAGLSEVPGLNQILAENQRDKSTSQTLVVIKPKITRLPISATISPQYLVGPQRGFKVLL